MSSPRANSYLRLVLDAIFGRKQFRNELVWCYTRPASPYIKQFLDKQTIFVGIPNRITGYLTEMLYEYLTKARNKVYAER